MNRVIEKHTQDLGELRRICLQCHGLDLCSSSIFTDSSYENPSEQTVRTLQNMISTSMLQLATAVRVNIYQGVLDGRTVIDRMAASIYYSDEMLIHDTTLKDVADKIIHAKSFSKSTLPKHIIHDSKIAFHLKGSHRGREWIVDICVELLAERILGLIDVVEESES